MRCSKDNASRSSCCRANQLFRQCLPDSDEKAKRQLHEWQSTGMFDHHPVPPMRLKNISQCLPDMWKVYIDVCKCTPGEGVDIGIHSSETSNSFCPLGRQ